MRVGPLTREYPPDVCGGAGVHVGFLALAVARRTGRLHEEVLKGAGAVPTGAAEGERG